MHNCNGKWVWNMEEKYVKGRRKKHSQNLSTTLISSKVIQYWEACHLRLLVIDKLQVVEVSFLCLSFLSSYLGYLYVLFTLLSMS